MNQPDAYKYKIISFEGPKELNRGEKAQYWVTIKNIGTETWCDSWLRSKAEAEDDTIGLYYVEKEEKDYFRCVIGENGEKTDRNFSSDNGRKRHMVKPGREIKLSFHITPKKFAPSGTHEVDVGLAFNGSREMLAKEEGEKVLVDIKRAEISPEFQKDMDEATTNPGETSDIYENQAYKDMASEDYKPVMMAVWQRVDRLSGTIADLEKQEGVKPALHLWVNNQEQKDQIKEIVNNSTLPIKVYESAKNIGGYGRFYLAKALKDTWDFVLFIDDDQTLENDSVANFFSEAESKTIKSQWAYKFNDVNNYWDKTLLKAGEAADYCGTGGMLCPTEIFENEEIFNCPKEYWFIEDLWLTFVATQKLDWKAEKSKTDLQIEDDGKDQAGALIDLKTDMLKYLVSEENWLLDV